MQIPKKKGLEDISSFGTLTVVAVGNELTPVLNERNVSLA